ncbi:MAG: 1-acyl-sn-glycerol-3-phosphate acyltransferase, partial [Candidatus Binatia bacterium]
FGFLGSVFLTVLPVFGKNALGLTEEKSAILLALLSIGIAAGSVLAARLSRGHVELGLVPLGSLGLSAFAVDLALAGGGAPLRVFGIPVRAIVDLAGIGLGGGLFIIPLNALLQQRSPAVMKGRLVAFSNVLTFAAVLAAAGLPWLLTGVFGFTTGQVILFVAALTVAGTVYVMNLLPDFFVRLVLWIVTNTAYRIRVLGAGNIPREGALFVANHVSWVDFLLIGAACDRMIRFLMYRGYYEWRLLNWFFRRMHAIPVAGGDPAAKTEESLALARAEVQAGHAVCIFAEGAITRTGNLLRFRRGLEKIAAGAGSAIVPIYLDGVWGSLFSFEGGRFFLKRPKRFRALVTVVFGEALPPTATALDVRRRIEELSVDAFRERKARQRPLAVEWLRSARRRWRRRFLSDASGRELTFGQALVESLAVREALFGEERGGGERVGILLPPGVPAALANLAVVLAGKVPVNLPDSVEAATLASQ